MCRLASSIYPALTLPPHTHTAPTPPPPLPQSGKKFDLVFVSSDKTEEAFTEYFGEHPWLALPFEDRKLKAELSKKFKVSGISIYID